jgi:hypothetical protein
MFTLHDQPIALDVAFTDPATGNQYPNNWLRLASPEERAAIGIKELPDPVIAAVDQRFYWDTGIPKDHKQLVEQWSEHVRTAAAAQLQPTDWTVIRALEGGKAEAPELKAWRQQIRDASNDKVKAIEATSTVDELASYVSGPDYMTWPEYQPTVQKRQDTGDKHPHPAS